MATEAIFLGWDPAEMRAHVVAETSLHAHSGHVFQVRRLSRLSLYPWYSRPTSRLNGLLWDEISDAPMSTDHAIARFFVPWRMAYQGWALFTDGDVLFRRDVRDLLALRDARYAVQVVQHPQLAAEGSKKAGHLQIAYPRKNWSSVVLWNCSHPAHAALTLERLNAWTGRELHAFGWLRDDDIGALPREWNYLVGVSEPMADPAIVHYTLGTPDLPGHADDPFADEWVATARAAGYSIEVPA